MLAELGGPEKAQFGNGQTVNGVTAEPLDKTHMTGRSMATARAAGKTNAVTWYYLAQ